MTAKIETRGRKVGTKLVDDTQRQKILFYVPTNIYNLLQQAKKLKIQTQGFMLNEIIKQAVKTVLLPSGEYKHALYVNGKEVVSIINNTPKQSGVMLANPKS